jgi:outer membrane protein insertion porin family
MDLHLKKIALSLVLSFALVQASTTIESIQYDGLVHISTAVAKQLNPVKVGEPLDPVTVDKAIKNFFEQGYFEDIWADEDNGVLTFHFKEKPVISKVELKGFKENDEEARKALLQIEKGSLFDPRRIESARKRIVEALNQEGKIDSVVEVESKKLDNGSMEVIFIANEGAEIIIKELKYYGVSGVDPSEFEKTIANKEAQFMGWMWGRNDGKMKIAELQYDPMRIRDYYMQNGYLDAKVDQPFTAVDFNRYEASMQYTIFEGDIFRVSDILVFQDDKVIDDQALLDVIKLKKNEPFNIKTFRDDADRIKTKIADLGYAFAQVQPDLRKDKESKTVEVVYRVIPGKKVHIQNVVISGNNRTLDRIIRRELFLAPGDLYSLTDLKDSRAALGRTGYFESTTIEEKRIDDENMDLIVQTKEAPTGNIQLGGGYGSYGGIMMSIAVSDRNIFGSGINVGVNLEKSQKTRNYAFNVSNPRLNDSDFSGNFSVYSSSTDYDNYSVDTLGMGVGVGHKFTRHLSGYLGYNYSDNQYNNISALNLTYQQRAYFQSYSKSSETVSMTFDNTDDYYVPREGMTVSQSLEYAGAGADTDFWKSRTNFAIYQGLQQYIDTDIILRYKARLSYVQDLAGGEIGDTTLPLNERLFMGGIGTVRGYKSYSISPSKSTYVDAKGHTIPLDPSFKYGGTQSFSNSVEVSVPLVPEAKMRATAFFDYGWIDATDDNQAVMGRGGYGISLEWFSPVGPLQLVFSQPYDNEPGDDTTNFEFTIGQRF